MYCNGRHIIASIEIYLKKRVFAHKDSKSQTDFQKKKFHLCLSCLFLGLGGNGVNFRIGFHDLMTQNQKIANRKHFFSKRL